MKEKLHFSARLRETLDEKGWRAIDLAHALSLSHVAVGKWLKGSFPTGDKVQALCRVLNVSPAWLLNGEGRKTPLMEDHLSVMEAAKQYGVATGGTQQEQQAAFDKVMEAQEALIQDERRRCQDRIDQVKRELKSLRERIEQIEQSL